MRTIRKILAATAVTGAATVSLLAGAAPASAADAGTSGFGSFGGWGIGSTPSFALWAAESDAKRQAELAGFNPILHCWVANAYTTEVTPTYYNGHVTLFCSN
ncbi:hypothetical protein [Micromonospora cathayae]|uniref:Bacteriocin (Lactococcin_972) n=1 Tax=Micromonospora cathayae TaxID=3028804 RepID=A0ABY7ZSW5_9ACTN|nr:hypothetical protein [Micromonospora sp. HUAS 3]WDZ85118.1 hypothetical protein PVK37_01210 [Micromonospora sp. HUAS 3]